MEITERMSSCGVNKKHDALFSLIHGDETNSSIRNLLPITPISSINAESSYDGIAKTNTSYGWSDFTPVTYREYRNFDVLSSSSTFSSTTENTQLDFRSDVGLNTSSMNIPNLYTSSHNSGVPAVRKSIDSLSPLLLSQSPSSCRRKESRTFNKQNKQVSFSNLLEIREHEIIIGDHPCCSDGMPLALGWDHSETELVDIDIYGQRKKNNSEDKISCFDDDVTNFSRRQRRRFRLTYGDRIDLLIRTTGLSKRELLEKQQAYYFTKIFKQLQ